MKSEASPYNFLAVPATPTRGNVTVFVTDVLRQAIVTLELQTRRNHRQRRHLQPAEGLALPRLRSARSSTGRGLVDILPQRGSTVSLVRISDVLEYMLIRKALESEAVRVVTSNHSDELIETLQRSMSYQKAACEIDDQYGFHERDLEFHDIIFGDMRFSKVKAVIEHTRANLDRARRAHPHRAASQCR